MSTGSPTSRLIMKVARIVLGADGLELQAVDDLSPPRLGQSDTGDDLSERATIRANERDRSQHGRYSDHQRGRTEPEEAHEQQGKADAQRGFRSHVDLAAALCAVAQVVDLGFEVGDQLVLIQHAGTVMPPRLALKLEREALCGLSREHRPAATEGIPCPSFPSAKSFSRRPA